MLCIYETKNKIKSYPIANLSSTLVGIEPRTAKFVVQKSTTKPLNQFYVFVCVASITIQGTSISDQVGKCLSRWFGQKHFGLRQLGYSSFILTRVHLGTNMDLRDWLVYWCQSKQTLKSLILSLAS